MEHFERDVYGNLLSYHGPLSGGTDDNYKVTYAYDPSYHQMTEKRYRKDASATVTETFVLTPDKKSVVSARVLENGMLRAQTDNAYDVYGNMTEKREHVTPGDAGSAAVASFAYAAPENMGALVSKRSVHGVEDASGALLPGSPGEASGVLSETWSYNACGEEIAHTSPAGHVTATDRDAAGRVTRVTHPDGTTTTRSFNDAANDVTETDECGAVLRYDYGALGELLAVTNVTPGHPVRTLKTAGYDALLRPATETAYASGSAGSITTTTYDVLSRATEKAARDFAGTLLSRGTLTYDDAALTAASTIHGTETSGSAPDIVTIETRDKAGRVIRKARGTSAETVEYDFAGNPVKATDARGNVTHTSFDHAGRAVSVTRADGSVTRTGYDGLGRKISATDARGKAGLFVHDAAGRLVEERTPLAAGHEMIKRYAYDRDGNVTRESIRTNLPGEPASWTHTAHAYDNRNRPALTTSYDGETPYSAVRYAYDACGRVTSVTAGLAGNGSGAGAVTVTAYDRFGNAVSVTDPAGRAESTTYDLLGRPLTATDRNGVTTTTTYDGLGRVVRVSNSKDGAANAVTTVYALTGAVASTANERGTFANTYDNQGRPVTKTGPDGAQAYGYDAYGNRASFSLTRCGTLIQSLAYAYDSMNRLWEVVENGAPVATYSYDLNGNRANLTYDNGNSEAYAYNDANLVTGVTNMNGSAVLSAFSYTYDLRGNQVGKTDHNGKVTTYAYDGLNRLTRESVSGGGGGAGETVYAYDLRNNRASLTVTGVGAKTVSYVYDACDRLVSEATTTTSKGTEKIEYAYDGNGNTVRRGTERTGTGLWVHEFGEDAEHKLEIRTYDGFGRLTAVNNDKANAYYAYNPDVLRARKTVDGQTTVHLWDGQQMAGEVYLAPNGTQTGCTAYLRGANLIATRESLAGSPTGAPTGASVYCLYNAHGDIVQRTGENGVSLWYNEYDAFGNMTATASPGNSDRSPDAQDSCPFGYCEEYLDKETGTVYLRARSYDPGIGRMMTEDAVTSVAKSLPGGRQAVDPLSLNLYVYCASNPVMFTDPSGFWFETVWEADGGGGFSSGIAPKPPSAKTTQSTSASVKRQLLDTHSINNGLISNVPAKVIAAAATAAISLATGKATLSDIGSDLRNLNPFNRDEKVAIDTKVFGFYKGSLVLRHDIPGASSANLFGMMFLNSNLEKDDFDTVKHEYGHAIQERVLGSASYIGTIAVPSVIGYLRREPDYFSQPWERTADRFGGVDRGGYGPNSLHDALIYFGLAALTRWP